MGIYKEMYGEIRISKINPEIPGSCVCYVSDEYFSADSPVGTIPLEHVFNDYDEDVFLSDMNFLAEKFGATGGEIMCKSDSGLVWGFKFVKGTWQEVKCEVAFDAESKTEILRKAVSALLVNRSIDDVSRILGISVSDCESIVFGQYSLSI